MTAIPLFFAFLALFHITTATCSKNCTFDQISPTTNLAWCPCNDGFQCASLSVSPPPPLPCPFGLNANIAEKVPLDYRNPTLGRAAIPLIKYPAKNDSAFGPYQGMILLNPGGPGTSGVVEALQYGALIQVSTLDFEPFLYNPD
jgi:hypothetical protein